MVHLKDYTAPEFWIRETNLHFDLFEDYARVRSNLKFERRSGVTASVIRLDGENLQFKGVTLDGTTCVKADGKVPTQGQYAFEGEKLLVGVGALTNPILEIEVVNEPQKNLACEGLYRSSGMFCTQCEAESFRRITYYVDRPDVMSVFTVTLTADKAKYPILLSNGNRTSTRDLEGGRHEATWFDPHKKPCYLFALVAGDLGVLRSSYVTASGRDVALEIYCRKGLEKRCEHAMDSLKKSMKWDEERFGLEYDLDIFMIVVADDFNMGAMENKGLNIFNAHYVLAEPATATDKDFNNIQAVVGHEYFHNWSGNRITCRDWFQLSLKEGLTVYRDQEFSADMGSRAVKRIEDVIRLRTHQFAEDSGPMAHPVRPQSYVAIDNFYTLTVYEKGAEVIRMIETLIGREAFRKGSDQYFKMYDGQAVTTDDFIHAMSLGADGRDFTQFKNWYDQAGTPTIRVSTRYLESEKKFEIKIAQSCAPSPGQPEKKPYLIPVAIGLLGRDAASGLGRDLIPTRVLELTKPEQTFVIEGIGEKPVLSLLRGFSAPVKVECEFSVEELCFLIANDSDAVARWEATQQLMLKTLKAKVAAAVSNDAERSIASAVTELEAALVESLRPMLALATDSSSKVDPAFVSFVLQLPSENYIAQFYNEVDVDAVFNAHEGLMKAIAKSHRASFEKIYERLSANADRFKPGADSISSLAQGERALRNTALSYLCLSDSLVDLDKALRQRRDAKDMTTELGALDALNRSSQPARLAGLEEFRSKWKDESLVMNKWLSMRAIAPGVKTLGEI